MYSKALSYLQNVPRNTCVQFPNISNTKYAGKHACMNESEGVKCIIESINSNKTIFARHSARVLFFFGCG